MSRKHYVEMAAVIADLRSSGGYDEPTLDRMAQRLADISQQDNPNFNRAKFYEAAGVKW